MRKGVFVFDVKSIHGDGRFGGEIFDISLVEHNLSDFKKGTADL